MLEAQTRELLTEALMNVPLLRRRGPPEAHLAALVRACLLHPVFPDWRSPVDAWLEEAEALSRELERPDILASLAIRGAEVRMRRLDYDGALDRLRRRGDAPLPLSPAHAAWAALTEARVLARRRAFDEARARLDGVSPPPGDAWLGGLLRLAWGELHLEANELDAAEAALSDALDRLPFERVEERIQAAQSLGFVHISRADVPRALDRLDEARRMLRGAGAWSQVVQMDLVVGSFHVAQGDQAAAQELFADAMELCREYPQPELETLLGLALARSRAAEGKVDEAEAAALGAARSYAGQDNVVGFVSVIVFIASLYTEARRYPRAYDTLAVGLAIAKKRRWNVVEGVLRTQVNRLRDDVMGPARFDAMVREMIRKRGSP